MDGLFVTGTGTEVGKTVVAAAIARTAATAGLAVAVFKPAVSGLDEAGEADHALLRRAAGSKSVRRRDRAVSLRAGGLAPPRRRAGRRGDRPATPAKRRGRGGDGRRSARGRGSRRLAGAADQRLPGARLRPRARIRRRRRGSPRAGDDQPHPADGRGGAISGARGGDGGADAVARHALASWSARTWRRSSGSAG